ncbi:MAG: YdbH domain-containing protein [Pseudomonadota bacterium]
MAITASLWIGREQIAGNLIDQTLADYDLEASYEIVSIGPQRQVIENFVLGEPSAPDLTAERLVVDLEYGFGAPGIGKIEVDGARLFGSYRDGTLSLGALDPLVFAETDEPAGLPALDLKLVDARARIDTDYGKVGIKLDGQGHLDDGFVGTIAATAPGLSYEGCSAKVATIYGQVTTRLGVPAFAGPVRLREADCQTVKLSSVDIAVELALNEALTDVDGSFDIAASELAGFGVESETIGGRATLSWRDGALNLQHEVSAEKIDSPFGSLSELSAEGLLRMAGEPLRTEWSAKITGEDAILPLGRDSLLSEASMASQGTLAAPLLAKLERSLAAAANGGRIGADLILRQSDEALSVVVPEARLRSGSGETLVSISRLSWLESGRLSGNIATGGVGLPQITGRMEQDVGGALGLRLSMQEYAAGKNRLAIPQLLLRQQANGDLEFSGRVAAGGIIPGGSIKGFEAPLQGTYSPTSGLALGSRCTPLRFARLSYFDLSLDGRSITLCPVDGAPLLAYRDALRMSAQVGEAMLTGAIAESPVTLTSRAAVIRYPEAFTVEGLNAVIGEPDNGVRLTAARASGSFGNTFSGEFSDATAQPDVVPLGVDRLAGNWRYEDNTFFIDEGTFRLNDRGGEQARFEPLFARDASMQLATNSLTATADLREPVSDRLVTTVSIKHNLASSVGKAEIDVPGVLFDDLLQPDQLTYLATGVIADTSGIVSGEGAVEWTADTITSGGTFRTADLDIAAAFGPVSGVSGEIEFTDLISLTTAPGQVLNIGSVNPGIEVISGEIAYQLTDGEIFTIEDGRWPFMGGELIVRPVTIQYGSSGSTNYVFELVGLDAATFVAQMELTNIGASGTFDGTVPIVFDSDGNGRIVGGMLISRPPGGNVAYVGELTYEDLGTISNYAFNALRSLDYSQMSIELNGNLAGEIITRLKFDGISQGEGATSNFITRRLAALPIRFNINVRSENFFELATVVRSFFDAEYLGNPVDRGLFDVESGQLVPFNPAGPTIPRDDTEPETQESFRRPDEPPVQPPESEELP